MTVSTTHRKIETQTNKPNIPKYVRYINSSQLEVKLAVQDNLKFIKYSQIVTFASDKTNGISAPTTLHGKPCKGARVTS